MELMIVSRDNFAMLTVGQVVQVMLQIRLIQTTVMAEMAAER